MPWVASGLVIWDGVIVVCFTATCSLSCVEEQAARIAQLQAKESGNNFVSIFIRTSFNSVFKIHKSKRWVDFKEEI